MISQEIVALADANPYLANALALYQADRDASPEGNGASENPITLPEAIRIVCLNRRIAWGVEGRQDSMPKSARADGRHRRVPKYAQRERERVSTLRSAQPPLRSGDYGYEPKRVGWDGNGETKRFRLATGQVLSEGTRI